MILVLDLGPLKASALNVSPDARRVPTDQKVRLVSPLRDRKRVTVGSRDFAYASATNIAQCVTRMNAELKPSPMFADEPVPLFVDLDGTLIKSDLLIESLMSMARTSPAALLLVPFWLLRGKAYLKQRLAERATVFPERLPYHRELLAYLEEEGAHGRPLLLASASNGRLVAAIAQHLGIFTAWIGSDATRNLAGRAKLAAIEELAQGRPFDYAANGRVDIPIWQAARRAIIVGGSERLVRSVRRTTQVERVFSSPAQRLAVFLGALRWHQWLKNLLIFIPLVVAHQLTEPVLLAQALVAFAAFSMVASGTYLLNDLLDLDSDRLHQTKRHRAFAAGALSPLVGVVAAPALLIAGAALCVLLPVDFALWLGVYLVTTVAYSLRLKRVIVLDVLTLAGLYAVRILAGGAAVGVEPSFWLMGFSMFMFFSLALVKRYSELRNRPDDGRVIAGRNYRVQDASMLGQLGASSSLMAVLMLALYIDSDNVVELYSRPALIWLICPIMLYWGGRIWLLTARGHVDEDPVVFAAKDARSYLLAGLVGAVLWVAT